MYIRNLFSTPFWQTTSVDLHSFSLIFGCDECVLACPYQKVAPVYKNKNFKYYPDRAELELKQILNMDEESFEKNFAGSAIKRLGLQGLKHNAQICLVNAMNRNHQFNRK